MKFKRPTKLPAPEYVDALMNWAQGILDDERVFPNQIGMPLSPHEHRTSTHTLFAKVCLSLGTSATLCARYSDGCSAYMRTCTATISTISVRWALKVCSSCICEIQRLSNACIVAHLNTSYRHFFLFVNEVSNISFPWSNELTSLAQFDLVDKKELAPLDELNDAILAEDKSRAH